MPLAGRRRKLVLTAHVASSVALLGTTAALAVMAGHAAASGDAGEAHAVYGSCGSSRWPSASRCRSSR
jgi:hypothetical protein